MKKIIISFGLIIVALGLFTIPTYAEDSNLGSIGNICDDGNDIPDPVKQAAGCEIKKEETVMPIAINIIQVVLSIVGILTVAMVVYGGILYVISNGDAVKLQRAKNTILYGIVGLVVSLLAFTLVTYISQSVWK